MQIVVLINQNNVNKDPKSVCLVWGKSSVCKSTCFAIMSQEFNSPLYP